MQTKVDTKRNTNVILCVDDEVIGLEVRKALLESRGYRVLTAENGPDALVLFSAESLNLGIRDYRTPNGDTVGRLFRRLEYRSTAAWASLISSHRLGFAIVEFGER